MKNLCIKDAENLNSTENILSILLTQDGLSYSLFHAESKRFVALVSQSIDLDDDYTTACLEFLEKENIVSKDYLVVNILVATNKTTIVPEALFQKDKMLDLFSLNLELSDKSKVLFCSLPKSGNVILFEAKNELITEFEKSFGDCNFMPQSYSFIENHYVKNKIAEDSMESKMYVQVFENFIEIIVLDKSELVFYNTFKYKTNNDLLYLIINLFEQLKLSQTDTSIGFSGLIETDNIAVLNLRKFVSVVYFESQNTDYKYYYRFQETSPHYFYNLLNVC